MRIYKVYWTMRVAIICTGKFSSSRGLKAKSGKVFLPMSSCSAMTSNSEMTLQTMGTSVYLVKT